MNITFRVLIVDDEPAITDALYDLLQAQALPIELYVAYRGRQALSILDNTRVDLLISDINMPDLSGLMLLEAVNKRWPTCKTIFLTGYADFSYAYEAIHNNAAGYVLKSDGDEVLLDRVRSTLEALTNELKQTRLKQTHAPQTSNIVDATKLFQTVVTTGQAQVSLNALSLMGLNEPYNNLVLMLALTPDGFSDESILYAREIARHYMGEALAHLVEVARPTNNSALWLCQFLNAPSRAWLNGTLETIRNSYLATTGEEISFMLSPSPDGGGRLAEIYRLTMHKLEMRELPDSDQPFVYTLTDGGSASPSVLGFVCEYISAHINEDISIAQVAAASGYNGDYLSRIFRQATGETLGKYISAQRLNYVKRLMCKGELTLEAIMQISGFSSRSYFNRFIKRETGLQPQQLQALMRICGDQSETGDF